MSQSGGPGHQAGENRSLAKAMEILQRMRNYNGQLNPEAQQHYNATHVVHFNAGLAEIVSKIEAARPVFVQCLKPNENSFSNQVNTDILIKQVNRSLISSNVLFLIY